MEKSTELFLKLLEKCFEKNIEHVSFNLIISYNPECVDGKFPKKHDFK